MKIIIILIIITTETFFIFLDTVMTLSFWTDMSGQTVQTQIRLLLKEQSDQGLHDQVYTVCHSVCIVWTHYSMVEPHYSNFRVITTNVLGVRIFRKFTVAILLLDIKRLKKVREIEICTVN